MSETLHHGKSAAELQQDEVALAAWKNWPDPRSNWLMNDEVGPLVVTSLATSGKNGVELAGGMSPAWGQPTDTTAHLIGGVTISELNLMPAGLKELPAERQTEIREARRHAAAEKMHDFLHITGERTVDPNLAAHTIVMKPQIDHYNDRSVEGSIVCADDIAEKGDYIEDTRPAFMMWSKDVNRVLGIRPADCPTVVFSAIGADSEPIHGLMHAGWQDEDAGFTEQGLAFLTNRGVDMASMNVYIAPGGVEFGYSRPTDPREGHDDKFTHEGWKTRITDVHEQGDKVRFTIDMVGFAVDRLREAGVSDEQIVIDSTDTSVEETGYSSHKQASRGAVSPTRDLVMAMSPYRDVV